MQRWKNKENTHFLKHYLHYLGTTGFGYFRLGEWKKKKSQSIKPQDFSYFFRLYQAVRYNSVLVLLLPWFLAYGAAFVRDFLPGKPIRIHQWLPAPLMYGLLAGLLLFGVLRNLPVEPFVWLRPTPLG